MQFFVFNDMRLDNAFRKLCSKLYFKAEAQQIDRILEAFANRYWECNTDCIFGSAGNKIHIESVVFYANLCVYRYCVCSGVFFIIVKHGSSCRSRKSRPHDTIRVHTKYNVHSARPKRSSRTHGQRIRTRAIPQGNFIYMCESVCADHFF